jgi:hypothetical protein
MVEQSLIPAEYIEQRIFLVRGQKVLLGTHLAELYGVETRVLMQAVKRNLDRFPADFMFSLTREEILGISQIVTSLKYSKTVYAFTEQGVAMLSGVLHSPRAVQVNIAIMSRRDGFAKGFVQLRRMLSSQQHLLSKLKDLEDRIGRHDEHIRTIFEAIRLLMAPEEKPKHRVGFEVKENIISGPKT